jgi:carbon storage regulator
MLILSRKPGDAIIIDGGIRVVVLACDGGGVRLGIEAPRSVGIVREEIVQGITDENLRAGASPEQWEWLGRLEREGAPSGGEDASREENDAADLGGSADSDGSAG